MWGNPFYHMWEFLPDALREYGPRWQQALGASPVEVFAALYEDPARLRRFVQLTNANSVPQGQLMAEQFDFTPYQCVLDVAGGAGGMVIAIGQRYPHLRGIVMDMPSVCAIAKEYIRAGGLRTATRPRWLTCSLGHTPQAQTSSHWATSFTTGAMRNAASSSSIV